MRVVRHQKAPSPTHKIALFWKKTPLCTKAVLLLIAIMALIALPLVE